MAKDKKTAAPTAADERTNIPPAGEQKIDVPPVPPVPPEKTKPPKYRVKSPMEHDHVFYDIGTLIDTLTPAQASGLCSRNIIELVAE